MEIKLITKLINWIKKMTARVKEFEVLRFPYEMNNTLLERIIALFHNAWSNKIQ